LSNISLVKIKGHKNFLGNEFADALATNNKKKIQEYIKKFENNKKF
jgi:ribonuclease HI